MTASEAAAIHEADAQYRRARTYHDREALRHNYARRPVIAQIEAAAAKRLARYGPSETIVVREVG